MGKGIIMRTGGAGAELGSVTAGAGDVLAGKVIVDKNGNPITGTLANNGRLDAAVNCDEEFEIPWGFTSGGTIRGTPLSLQTPGYCLPEEILEGSEAWVQGEKIVGTMQKNSKYGDEAVNVFMDGDYVAFNIDPKAYIIPLTGNDYPVVELYKYTFAELLGFDEYSIAEGHEIVGIRGSAPWAKSKPSGKDQFDMGVNKPLADGAVIFERTFPGITESDGIVFFNISVSLEKDYEGASYIDGIIWCSKNSSGSFYKGAYDGFVNCYMKRTGNSFKFSVMRTDLSATTITDVTVEVMLSTSLETL